MKNVLLVSYFSPPNQSIGSLRIAKMLKYLPLFGYQPYVLSGIWKGNNNPYVFQPRYIDPLQIAKKIRNGIKDHLPKTLHTNDGNINIEKYIENENRPKGLYPLSEVRMPDKFMCWILPAIRFGKKLLEKQKFDIIYSSSGPVSSAIVASKLQKFSNLPWVAEFRDLWSENHFDLRKEIVDRYDKCLENKTLQNCSALVTVSEPLKEQLLNRHKKPTYIVYNGYDVEDYPIQTKLTKKFTITYTGKIYQGKQDPTYLFEAIANLSKAKKITPNVLQIRFYGPDLEVIIRSITYKYGIQDYIYIGGVVPYEESLIRQSESWLLLLLEWNDPLTKGILTGKFFEYLGAKRPILSISYEKGSVGDILAKTGSGVVLNSPKDIEEFLILCLDEYSKNNKSLGFTINDDEVASYSRKNTAEELSKIFSSLSQYPKRIN